MKLLITDDQNSVHLFLDRMLPYEELGITQVFHAKNGQKALECIKAEWPELILLDIRMPVMDGMNLLENIKGLAFEHRVMILSAYEEFEYAKKCMRYGVKDYLLKPIDIREVRKTLEQSIQEIVNIRQQKLIQTFERYLSKTADGTEFIPDELEQYGYGIVCFENGNTPEFMHQDIKLLAGIELRNLKIHIYQTKDQLCWKEFYDQQKDHNPDVRIGFGHYHIEKKEVQQALTESIEALYQGFYNPGTYYYEKDSLTYYYRIEVGKLSEQLKKSFEIGDVQEIKQEVEKLFLIFKRGKVHPDYVWDFCYGFLIQLNADFVETLNKLRNTDVSESLHSVDSAGVKNTFLRLILSMRLELPPEEVQTDEEVVCKIRHYIDSNYEKDISLTTLSKHFFISKYQISRLFKKQFGVNYSDYVLKVRMEAAEVMLRNSKSKIDDIAVRAGFEETSYFSKVFSKYFGMSPGEYRKKAFLSENL